jgi:hypothetical protein
VDTGPNDEDVHQKYKKDTNEHHWHEHWIS